MKKTILISVFVAINMMSLGQVFNTGQTLKPKTFSVGIEPRSVIRITKAQGKANSLVQLSSKGL